MRAAGLLGIAVLWLLPLVAGLVWALTPLGDAAAWAALFAHPQAWSGLVLSLWTGSAAALLAGLLAFRITAGIWRSRYIGLFLALPHLALAIGLGFLVMPSGILARGLAFILGWTAPPGWVTVHDPLGLSLIAALVLKETPFLIFALQAALQRAGSGERLRAELAAARSLGHSPASAWWRVAAPQLLRQSLWPLAIVWVYGASVVDMAIAIGPAQPPPFAVVVWHDLNAAEAATNARGAAGALLLSLVLAACAIAIAGLWRLSRAWRSGWITRGPVNRRHPGESRDLWTGLGKAAPLSRVAPWVPAFAGMTQLFGSSGQTKSIVLFSSSTLVPFTLAYLAVLLILVLMSVAGPWPFPDLLPERFTLNAWRQLAQSAAALWTSLALALPVAGVSVLLAVLWFETMPERLDRILLPVAVLALALPAVLIAGGQYGTFLQGGLTGSWTGLFLVHLTPAFAYALVLMAGPYRGFDGRLTAVAASLGVNIRQRWWRLKAPVLRATLAQGFATAFAVSFAQFVPAQLMAAGRFSTLPMQAVTLASGGNRPLLASFALALAAAPALVFLAASWAGRPRWACGRC